VIEDIYEIIEVFCSSSSVLVEESLSGDRDGGLFEREAICK
jgi:hypothetical protein